MAPFCTVTGKATMTTTVTLVDQGTGKPRKEREDLSHTETVQPKKSTVVKRCERVRTSAKYQLARPQRATGENERVIGE